MAVRKPFATIDIGSNSVRLVVYSGAERVPTPIFNEKVMAGLGAGLGETGLLSKPSIDRALGALRRFRILLDHMGTRRVRTVATAAVRDARNGGAFVRELARIGLDCEVLKAEEEARLAGEGVLSAIPGADGIVGDLGGGSLELVDVAAGRTGHGISVPLGVLRLAVGAAGERRARETLRASLGRLKAAGRGRTLYMVGGSWRALAKIHMLATDYPLPVIHQYRMPVSAAKDLPRLAGSLDPKWAKAISSVRLASSPVAAMLLALLVEELEPDSLVLSNYGIREGLHFSTLRPKVRTLDPLIDAARDAGEAERRFGPHGDLLDHWIGGLFQDAPPMRRLRLSACLLADVAWQANAAFRADRAVEMALHGNWVGIDGRGRVIIAQALSSSFGRDKLPDPKLADLCAPDDLERARQWGLAMRLGQRLSAGVGAALQGTSLTSEGGSLLLSLDRRQEALAGEPVERRLSRLAGALGQQAEIRVG